MNDSEIMQHIATLVDEEHDLERAHERQPLGADDRDRLRSLEVALDQCWDLLRQRRARRDAGQNPDDVHPRPTDVVEHYQQ
jgi:hypothetical protein